MAQSQTILLNSLDMTNAFGLFLGITAGPGDVITLEGGLGTGKTTLTQAIGTGLETPASFYITSPTFALMHEYPGRIPLIHMDLYRLGSEEEIEDLGFTDFLYGEGQGLTIIEWPERLGSLMPENRLHIRLFFSKDGENAREAHLTAYGVKHLKYLQFQA